MISRLLIATVVATAIVGCGGGSSDGTSSGKTTGVVTDSGINLSTIAKNSTLIAIQCNELNVANTRFAPKGIVNQCWQLEVPEDYSKPNEKKIKIAVSKLPSQSKDDKRGAFAFLFGGPGAGLVAHSEKIDGMALNLNHDVYLVDQRGTGFSTPALYCSFGEGGTTKQITDCKNKHENNGVDLAQYTNQFNAFDFLVLEKKLTQANELSGHWKLYGNSYGTRLAMTIAREEQRQIKAGYQSNGAIDMMVLDGVLPIEVNGIKDTPWANYESLDRLLEVCKRSAPYCDESDFKNKLNKMYVELDSQYHIYFTNYLIQKSMSRDDSSVNRNKYTPVELVKQDPAVLATKIIDMVNEQYDVNHPESFAGMGLSNICTEAPNKPAKYSVHPSRAKWGANVQKAIDASYHMEFSSQACTTWNVKSVPARNYQLPDNITYPVLLLNGANDGQTPPAWAALASNTFSNSLSLTQDSEDHGILFASINDDPTCLGRLITSAINNPSNMKSLNTSCLDKADFKYRPTP